ncbi:MAG: beta-ketoacyl-ACP synthase III [Thermodesulfobacteriota bacterium]
MNRMVIAGTGSCLPATVLSNRDLERMVDTSDEWITTRTGISTRRIAGQGDTTSRLAVEAGQRALLMAGWGPDDLDMIVTATITPDMTMPSAACLVQQALGAGRAFAFDLNAACAGFVYALAVAERFVRQQPHLRALVLGAETLSGRVNWQDRGTCVLFGDGAGACVVTGSDNGHGLLATRLYSDGRLWSLLSMHGAPSRNPALASPDNDGSYIRMQGREVFRYAVRAMEQAAVAVLADAGLDLGQIDLVIPHQANVRIVASLAERLGLPLEKFYLNIDKYGNTSAASIPIALDEAVREGRIRRGDAVLLCAFGGGFTWGAAVVRW